MLSTNHLRLLSHLEQAAVERNGFAQPEKCDPDLLRDLENAKLFKNMGTATQPLVHLTIDGWELSHHLRQHQAHGGTLENFPRAVTEKAPV